MGIRIISRMLLLLYLIVDSSCNNNSENNVREERLNITKITINKIPELKILSYSDLFDSIRLIKLETKKESLIGRIDKILFYNNFYLILDMVQSKAVFQFDDEGNFLRKIGQKGKGPGEFLEPYDIAIDQFSNKIIIYSGRKLLFYDFQGNYIEEIKLDYGLRSFSVLDKDIFAYYFDYKKGENPKTSKFNLLLVNKKGKILNRAFDAKENIYPSLGSRSFFNVSNDKLLVSPSYSNILYRVDIESIIPNYCIDFDKYTIPREFVLSSKSDIIFYKELKKSNYAFLRDFFETHNYLAFSFVYKGMIYSCYFSKKTGSIKFANCFINNLFGLFTESSMIATTNGDLLIGYFEPSNNESYKKILNTSLIEGHELKKEYMKYVESWGLFPELIRVYVKKIESTTFNPTKEDIETINSLSPLDNPVLVVHKIKEF
jgi:hypothetical protein